MNIDLTVLPWERENSDTPRADKIIRDYFDKEAIRADDFERDLHKPMQQLERELAEQKAIAERQLNDAEQARLTLAEKTRPRKPITDEQIKNLFLHYCTAIDGVRAITKGEFILAVREVLAALPEVGAPGGLEVVLRKARAYVEHFEPEDYSDSMEVALALQNKAELLHNIDALLSPQLPCRSFKRGPYTDRCQNCGCHESIHEQ